ncbi:MAG: NUDIX domain-containing protein [Beijerinckiaceae bacterium]|nr:NUDIX domain-containing protein [Beijerinckiaceae bacterium]MCZ8301029.1 NUDIX domain-containing protein [Beijerinckiaceae bacterium]
MGEGKGQAGLETGRDARGRDTSLSRVTPSPSSLQKPQAPPIAFWKRVLRRVLHLWFYLSRGMTLGVRAIALDGEGRIFLVRHTYMAGWHLPGGGVEWGQSLLDALAMELREEGNLVAESPPELVGLYWNRHVSRRDHVAVYAIRKVQQTGPRLPDREIAEARFFPLDSLPEGATAGTRARLAEWLEGRPASPFW